MGELRFAWVQWVHISRGKWWTQPATLHGKLSSSYQASIYSKNLHWSPLVYDHARQHCGTVQLTNTILFMRLFCDFVVAFHLIDHFWFTSWMYINVLACADLQCSSCGKVDEFNPYYSSLSFQQCVERSKVSSCNSLDLQRLPCICHRSLEIVQNWSVSDGRKNPSQTKAKHCTWITTL